MANQDTRISGKTLLGVFFSALVSGLVGGAFLAYRTLNNDHFTIISHSEKLMALEEADRNFVERSVYQADQREINYKLDLILDYFNLVPKDK